MFSTVSRKKLLMVLASLGGLVLAMIFSCMPLLNMLHAQARASFLPPVKILIITMFPLERNAWLKSGNWTVASHPPGSIHIPNTPDANSDGTVWCQTDNPTSTMCNGNGVYLTMTGPEKTNAATSMTAVLRDPDLSFTGAYFLTTGTAATSPASQGTLGFVSWAHWIADRDQGTHLIPRTAPGIPLGYQTPTTTFTDSTAKIQLNNALVQQAFDLTNHMKLADSPEAQAERALYPGQADRKPGVAMCDTATTDSFLIGQLLSLQTKYITGQVTDTAIPGNYCTMQEEDSSVAGVLKRFSLMPAGPNYLSCYLNLRAASTYDQPPPSQSVESFLQERFRVNDLALTNLLRVASAEIEYLLMHAPCSSD